MSVVVATPNNDKCGNVCCGIVLKVPPFLQCSKCHRVWYCSKECQKEAWKAGHKRECVQNLIDMHVVEIKTELTKNQKKFYKKTCELYAKGDWQGMMVVLKPATEFAEQLRDTMPELSATIYGMLGVTYRRIGQHIKAIEVCEQGLEIVEKTNNYSTKCLVYTVIGCCYTFLGKYDEAIKMHKKSLEISKKFFDRRQQGIAYSHLGLCYEKRKQYDVAILLLDKATLILQEVSENKTLCFNFATLGRCNLAIGEFKKALNFHSMAWNTVQELDSGYNVEKMGFALKMGIVIWAIARLEHSNVIADSITISGLSDNIAFMKDMSLALEWFTASIDLAKKEMTCLEERGAVLMHLSFFFFDTGNEEKALVHLREYLQTEFKYARSWCKGCGQNRGEEAPMLTCSGCSVSRFCNEEHQKMASEKGGPTPVRHKDLCLLLRKWRRAVKGKTSVESCNLDLIAFLKKDLWWRSHTPIVTKCGAGL